MNKQTTIILNTEDLDILWKASQIIGDISSDLLDNECALFNWKDIAILGMATSYNHKGDFVAKHEDMGNHFSSDFKNVKYREEA